MLHSNIQNLQISQVVTSEAKRALINLKFGQWLAGIIDGDGSFHITQKGITSLEIVMDLEDYPLLAYIKNKFGGSIKLRSGAKNYRYRLHHDTSMINLIKLVNGNIQNSKRLLELHSICLKYNIIPLEPVQLTKDSSWFAGFFDAVGKFDYYYNNKTKDKDKRPKLSISISHKQWQILKHYQNILDGKIHYDESSNGYYTWIIENRNEVIETSNYLTNYCRSNKSKRFHLVSNYFKLYDLESFSSNSPHYSAWTHFNKKWYNNLS